jgi:AcrR family transcriptional regulator
MAIMADPVTRERWIDAALDTLARDGLGGVGVEPIARQLRVTKGSFYWHFKDRADLLRAMLVRWEQVMTRALIGQAEAAGGTAQDRLRVLFRLSFEKRAVPLEMALRDWGRREPFVTRAVARVDRRRLRYLERLFGGLGLEPGDARARAFLAYSSLFGTHIISVTAPRHREDTFRRCRALLLKVATGSP